MNKKLSQILKITSVTLLAGVTLGSVGTINSNVHASSKSAAYEVNRINKGDFNSHRLGAVRHSVRPKLNEAKSKISTKKSNKKVRQPKRLTKQVKRNKVNRKPRIRINVKRTKRAKRAKRTRRPVRRFYASRYYLRTWRHAQKFNTRSLRFDHHQLKKLYRAYNQKGVTRAGRRGLRYHIKALKSTMRGVNSHLKIDNYKLSLLK